MHQATRDVLQFFSYDHLPEVLQKISKPFSELAHVVSTGPEHPQTTICLHKLLEAKDAAVRAWVAK